MSQIVWRGTTWTYGNWGGKGWSAGEFTPEGQKVDREFAAQDALDQVFKDHDINYEAAKERLEASPQSREDMRNYWRDIISADEQMIRDIKDLRDSGALGEPPDNGPTYEIWDAAQQAQLAFETAVAVHRWIEANILNQDENDPMVSLWESEGLPDIDDLINHDKFSDPNSLLDKIRNWFSSVRLGNCS